MHQYKVLTHKDRALSGKFDPQKLETALNSYAAEGWRVVVGSTAEFAGGMGKRQEFVLILEREYS